MQESGEGVPEKEKDQSRLDILGMAAATEGAANLLDIDKVLNEIDDSIIFVDKSFKNLVNTMGRGESYAEGFGKMLEATAKEIIRAGGTRDDASKIQLETLGIMGRASMLSQKQAVDLFNASKVTGVASKDLTEAFLDSGRNLSNISKEMLVVRETAQSLGVNAKQTSALVVSNLDKLNRFTFRGGVEGLAKMAANSQSMRIGMESTFELVDELMNPEKAIEMASEFQRMGIASADLTNPLKLMSMEAGELQEKIGEAMSDYVTIGEDGTKTISSMGRRVMKNLAAQGIMTRDELEKLAIGTREVQDKMSKINFSGFNLDEDTKKLIANVAQLGEGGVYEISTKDKDGNIVQKSIEDFVQDFGGDQEKLREALLSKEEKTGDASKDMSAIAQGQLDALTRITQQNEELKASIGFTVSASKLGPELLKASVELNKFINTPLLKNLGSESDLGKGLDTSTKEIKTALEDFKSGNLTKEGLLKLLGDLGGTGKKLAGTFGEVGVNVVKDYAGQLGIGEETVTAFISGIKEKLPELKGGGAEVAYTILSGINEALEAAGIELPENLKEIYDVIEKETGTGGIETPKPPVLGSDKTTETPSPTPAETEKPKPPVLGSEITPGTGGDEGLLFLEDLQNLDLQQLTSQLIQPLEKLDVGTSEVGTLNVQNLVIGSGLEKTITPKEGEPLINQEQVESVVKPTVTPTLVQPSINISQPIPQEELPSVPETTEELPSLKKVVEEPKEDKKGFFEKVNNFVQELKTEPVKENLNLNEVLKPVPTTEPSEITKTFEKSLDNISKLKMPELGIFKKEEQKPSDLVKGFEDSAKKMADLKIGGLEEKPSILGKFISKKQSETEEEPKEEKKGKFSKIKDAFVKSFIEPENTQEEYETIVPKYGEEPTQIEPIAPVTEEPTSIGRTIDELEPTTTDTSVKPELTEEVKEIEPITELKIDTSEVGTLNVQNLNIGTALDGIVNALGVIPQNQTQLTTLEGLDLEAAVAKTTPTETASITEEGLPTIEEGLPEVDTTLKKTRGGFAKTEPSFSEMEYGSKAPSQYESFKKVLEESYGGEIIGTGAEAFVLTPEMKSQAKKDSEFIGPEKPIDLSEELNLEKIKTKTGEGKNNYEIIKEQGNLDVVPPEADQTKINPKEGVEGNINNEPEKIEGPEGELVFDEKGKKYIRENYFEPSEGEQFQITEEITDEDLKNMYQENSKYELGKRSLQYRYKEMKAGQLGREAKKAQEKGEEDKAKELINKRDEYIKYTDKIDEEGEVESFNTKIETKGLNEDKGLAPMKPTLASLPIPEKEEKQPLVKRIKEGIGGLKEKFKGKQEEETPIAAVPETQEEYVVKDKDGNIIGTSSTERTARLKGEKFAGGKTESMGGFTVEKQTATPKPPETPSVGVEKAAAEVKEPKTLRERIEQGADKLSGGIEKFAGKIGEKFEGSKIKSKIDEARSKIKPQEEESKIEPIKPETVPTLSEEDKKFQEERQRKMEEESKIISSVQTDAYGKPVTLGGEEKSGYLKMLEENDAEADKFLTSKSGRPVNLDNDKTEKIEPKLPTEKTKPFSISDIKLSDFMPEDDGTIVEPAEVFPTEDEVRQNKEKEETKARSFAYLEELRLREQTPSVPETPAKGIEKLAQLGQKFEGKIGGLKGKLFGKKEEEESSLSYYEPGISTEEPYMSDSIEEAAAIEDYGTPAETPEAETETPVGKIEEVTPIVPEPATLPFFNWEDILGLSSEQGQPATQGESAQNINMKLTLEIVGNGEFAKLIDPRQFQSKIEMAMMQGIGKTQVAQRFNTASSFETASMGLTDSIKRY